MNNKMKVLMMVGTLALTIVCFGITSADSDLSIPTAQNIATTTAQEVAVHFVLPGNSNDAGSITFATSTNPANGTLSAIGADGSVTYTPNIAFVGDDSFQYIVTEGATSSPPATATITVTTPPTPPQAETVRVAVFGNGVVATSTTITLPASDAPDVQISADDGASYPVPARSALGILHILDGSPDFALSDVHHDPSLGLYVKCVSSQAFGASPVCDFWLYAVNGFSPFDGLGAHLMKDDDTLYLYAGALRKVVLDHASVVAGDPVVATLEQFDPATSNFATTTGFTIGAISIPDPSTPWIYSEVATSTANAQGQAIFTLNATGTYQVGVQEDFYFPTATLSVTEAASTTPVNPPPQGGGGGGGGPVHGNFNMNAALSYLASKQKNDGSFGAPLYDDWVAIALASQAPSTAREKLRNYLLSANPTLSSPTDYERHAMALESMSIDPYSGTSKNYIAPILAAFDGTQVGDPAEDNDDIFASLALARAGYSPNDALMEKIVSFVLSKQKPDGSWDESPDLTAAALQVLPHFFGTSVSPAALGQALGGGEGYLIATQLANGGWGNLDSTSWVQVFINAVQMDDPGNARAWSSSAGYLPMDVVAAAQQSDGGVRPTTDATDMRVWSTAYAIIAASQKDWDAIQQRFPIPTPVSAQNGGGGSSGESSALPTPRSIASPTPPASTSTPEILGASSTIEIASSTATTTKTASIKRILKKKYAKKIPSTQTPTLPTLSAQTAAANGSGNNFFSAFLHSITSFVTSLF